MPWMAAIFLGLLTGAMAAFYAFVVADLAVPWLRIATRDGADAYFVFGTALLGFVGGGLAGIIICRLAGHAGPGGTWRGFSRAVLVVGGVISAWGGWAWTQRDVVPLVGGQRVDLALELRLPPGVARPAGWSGYAHLYSGARRRSSSGTWQLEWARLEDGRWIVPGRVAVTTSEASRVLALGGLVEPAGEVALPLPARPAAIDAGFGPWITGAGWDLRYRVEPHRPPRPPR